MAHPPKWIAESNAEMGWLPSLRNHWRTINCRQRQADAQVRAHRKARDKHRPKCRCGAYPWPHRPRGGLCRWPRWPDPPLERYVRRKPRKRYGERYAGLLRQIARTNGLHPIRDRAQIERIMPAVLRLAKYLKQQCPRIKYRNILITETGVRGVFQTPGPRM
jgi:hypothetical protein